MRSLPRSTLGSARLVLALIMTLAKTLPQVLCLLHPSWPGWKYHTARFLFTHQSAPKAASNAVDDVQSEVRGSDCAKLEDLNLWLDAVGVDRGGSTKIVTMPGRGLGLEAAVDLERDSTVASIPRHLCLSSDASDAPFGTLRASAHKLIVEILDPGSNDHRGVAEEGVGVERDIVLLALQVLLEKRAGADSAFAPWMAMLPESRELNMPPLWPSSDLRGLQRTLVLEEVERCLAQARLEWELVSAAMSRLMRTPGNTGDCDKALRDVCVRAWNSGGPSYREWLHARCLVQSRAYHVGQRYLLIPLVDFANHDDIVAYAVCAGDGVFTNVDEIAFVADREYAAGQEVCTTYGDMDNAKRLFSFGFVTLYQAADGCSALDEPICLPTDAFCDVTFCVKPADHLLLFKNTVLHEHGLRVGEDAASRSALFPLRPGHPIRLSQLAKGPARMFLDSIMPALRLLALTPDDLRRHDLRTFCEEQEALLSGADEGASVTLGVPIVNELRRPADAWDSQGACLSPQTCPTPKRGQSDNVLRRLSTRLSPQNEERALQLLRKQCTDRLRAIRLGESDAAALMDAVGTAGGYEPFAVRRPRSLLCAAVRAGEAIAWSALREACHGMGKCDAVGDADEHDALASWLLWQCRSDRRTE